MSFVVKGLKREQKRSQIKSYSSIKETSVGVSQKRREKVKSSVAGQPNSRQNLDSEAEDKVKTWHRPCRVFEREGKRRQGEVLVQV